MGRFHRHDDGTAHSHDHGASPHDHDHPDHGHDHHDHAELVGDHSGYETGTERIDVLERIFDENDHWAAHNREAFDTNGVAAVNLMSSPGAGKTTLLGLALARLREQHIRTGIIEGDIETALDADRLRQAADQVSLLNTGHGFGGECHLDAPMVAHAMRGLDLSALDLVVIENVGNLVCPAEFETGAQRKAMVWSVTEGEDKPLKYPVMFRIVDAIIVNKTDLLPYLSVDMDTFEANVRAVNPAATILRTSAKTGEGINALAAWLGAGVSVPAA